MGTEDRFGTHSSHEPSAPFRAQRHVQPARRRRSRQLHRRGQGAGRPGRGAAPPAAGGNGGPSLEGTFSYIERIGRAVYGDLWVGKMAVELDKHPRQFRRWADGQGKPPEVLYTSARIWALRTAARLLKSVGEDDLAYEVGLVATRAAAEAVKKGAEIHQANLARAAEQRAAKESDKG